MPLVRCVSVVLLACVLAVGTANAQDPEKKKSGWDVWIDFHLGANFLDGSKGFTDYMHKHQPALDYRGTYLDAIEGGVGAGVEYGMFTLGMYVDKADGNSGVSVKNQLVKKEDINFHLDLGYRIPLGNLFTLEPTAGFGVGFSDMFLATSRGGADYVGSFTTANLIVPLTLNLTKNSCNGDAGIYLQYIIGAGQLGTTRITGLDTEVADLHFQPSTLTFGAKYRF